MKIELDPQTHVYTVDGRSVPGIHTIAERLNLIDPSVYPEEARTKGQYIHEAIELDLRGKLDRESCPGLVPYVDAVRMALADLGLRVDAIEELVACPTLGYATRIDALAMRIGDSARMAVNWKSGAREWFHALQSAAERLCLPHSSEWVGLYLYLHPDEPRRDGKPYTAVYHDNPADEDLWRCACQLYNALCRDVHQSVRPRGATPETKTEALTMPIAESTLFAADCDQMMESNIFPYVDDPVEE